MSISNFLHPVLAFITTPTYLFLRDFALLLILTYCAVWLSLIISRNFP